MANPIKIIGVPFSQNVRKPLAVAHHLGLEVENPPLAPNDPSFKELHAAGRIPVLDDDGYRICESNAIMIYLCSKTKNDLYPEEAKARGLVNQFLFWDVAHWTPAYQPIQFERLVKGMLGLGETDEAVVEAALQRFAREAAYLEGALAGKSWLVGDGATLADFAAGAGLTHAAAMGLPLEDFPNIRAWNDRVQGLEGFKKTEVKM
ncbi:MAG: glutathione S-transferase [Parvularcula sp.]|nr:glutathione S-transferase [Parvularcula sp.]